MADIIVAGNTSGSITLSAPAVSGSSVLTLPVATDTLVGKATTDTLTNKTLTTPTISSLSSASATALTLQSAGTTAITVDTSQNVGIGTASPAYKLHSATTIGTGSTGNNGFVGFKRSSDGVEIGSMNTDGTNVVVNTGAALAFQTSGTERMRLDSSGNVLVGTATNNSRNPRLALNGNSVTWAVGPNSSNSTFVVYNPSEAGVYLPSGNTAWVSTSDERLKNITGEITDAINKVSQLRAAEFTWKSDESNKPQVGLIAQDVQTVLPEAISENDKEFLGVSYTDVIPLLVASIKEQQTIINDLKARITALEGLSA